MHWRNNNGGWNKSHDQIEKTPRIDSFEARAVKDWGTLSANSDRKPLLFECERYTDYAGEGVQDREIVELHNPWEQSLDLTRIPSGFGGSRAYWLCPACGGRARYLYLTEAAFLCRKCARLNYRSQQETRSDSMYYYHKGMALVEKHLYRWPLVRPDGFSFCVWIPERPRYMHQTTYRRYLARFFRYQKKHADRQIEDIQRILNILGG